MGKRAVILTFLVLLAGFPNQGRAEDINSLAKGLRPFHEALSGKRISFEISGQVTAEIDGKPQAIDLRLARYDDQAFDLELTHAQYAVVIRRRAKTTAFALPKHGVVFIGNGKVDPVNHLSPMGITSRLVGPGSNVSMYAAMVQNGAPQTLALFLTNLLKFEYDKATGRWRAGKEVSLRFDNAAGSLQLEVKKTIIRLKIKHAVSARPAADDWPKMKQVKIERTELERTLARGVRRALEVLSPSTVLTMPKQEGRVTDHGELRWVEGQRVALLRGTPEQIGKAHGQLLKVESRRCIDSVLYAFGTVQTIRTGRWFAHELAAAYKRLSPHIPDDHKRETRAMALSLGIEPRLAQVLNVFPELFHCSGFAVFGTATKGGKLYHGRVLDYMTTIGLQDAATTFIVAVDGKIPFANVGYAGFTGSVSGMNTRAISLGEMGGRGEGQWDGVPMATLMRRALEECSTLDEVIKLWKTSPRTCEYYYVFADGKTNRAVGVAATSKTIEFIFPGQGHHMLGAGIKDAVVLSAGKRLKTLRARVKSRHGTIDTDVATWLMSRPVAMKSNLHNVLFVPADGVMYVANADHKKPAAENRYVKFDLKKLLGSMKQTKSASTVSK